VVDEPADAARHGCVQHELIGQGHEVKVGDAQLRVRLCGRGRGEVRGSGCTSSLGGVVRGQEWDARLSGHLRAPVVGG